MPRPAKDKTLLLTSHGKTTQFLHKYAPMNVVDKSKASVHLPICLIAISAWYPHSWDTCLIEMLRWVFDIVLVSDWRIHSFGIMIYWKVVPFLYTSCTVVNTNAPNAPFIIACRWHSGMFASQFINGYWVRMIQKWSNLHKKQYADVTSAS